MTTNWINRFCILLAATFLAIGAVLICSGVPAFAQQTQSLCQIIRCQVIKPPPPPDQAPDAPSPLPEPVILKDPELTQLLQLLEPKEVQLLLQSNIKEIQVLQETDLENILVQQRYLLRRPPRKLPTPRY